MPSFSFSQLMQQLYNECTLVHADLSEYNMLWHAGKVRDTFQLICRDIFWCKLVSVNPLVCVLC